VVAGQPAAGPIRRYSERDRYSDRKREVPPPRRVGIEAGCLLIALVGGEYRNKLRRILNRQRIQQHRVDQRKDRCVGANPERQR
jgi:hypothetical protein